MLSSIASKMKTEFTKMHLLLLIFLVIKKLYFSKLRKSWSHKIVQFLPEADKIHSINPIFYSHLSEMMLMNDLIMGACSWSPAIKFAHLNHQNNMENEKTEGFKSERSKLTVAVVAGFILHALVICVLCYGWANQNARESSGKKSITLSS